MGQTMEFSAALRRSIEGVILIIFLLIISGVAGALPGGGTYLGSGLTLATVIQLVIGLVVIGVLLGIRAPLGVVVNHYASSYLKLQEVKDRAKYVESVRGISSAIVSLVLVALIYLSFIAPLSPVLDVAGIPPWTVGVLFFLVGIALLFSIYQKSRPIISDVSERLAKTIAPTAAANTMFCASCGKKIPRTSKFCNFCGATQS
jgi:sterol desaturase/sphingolipid hydroxylase (fatty acid hydroxylase superfamily)